MYRFSGLFFFYRLLIFGLNFTDYWFFAKFCDWLAISGHTFYWLAIFGSKFYRLAVFGCYWLAISEVSHSDPRSYGHVMPRQSVHLNTILFLGKLEQVFHAHTFACIILTTTLLDRINAGEWPEKLFHESMGPGQDWTSNPWVCSQNRT